jgi:hypothetical protein
LAQLKLVAKSANVDCGCQQEQDQQEGQEVTVMRRGRRRPWSTLLG